MTHDEWLERYRRARIERDADMASTLFTEDAIYREPGHACGRVLFDVRRQRAVPRAA